MKGKSLEMLQEYVRVKVESPEFVRSQRYLLCTDRVSLNSICEMLNGQNANINEHLSEHGLPRVRFRECVLIELQDADRDVYFFKKLPVEQ